jgi:hypothetical protein
MAADIPSAEPLAFTAGDTLQWTRDLSDYLPSDGWVASYALRKSGATVINITGTSSGALHLVSVTASTTAGYTAGEWAMQGYVTKAATSQRFQIYNGLVTIHPNLAAQTSSFDPRSYAKQVLDAIETVQLAEASKTLVSWSGLELSIAKMSLLDREKLRDQYRVEYQNEIAADRIARGLGTRRNIFVRFDPTRPR